MWKGKEKKMGKSSKQNSKKGKGKKKSNKYIDVHRKHERKDKKNKRKSWQNSKKWPLRHHNVLGSGGYENLFHSSHPILFYKANDFIITDEESNNNSNFFAQYKDDPYEHNEDRECICPPYGMGKGTRWKMKKRMYRGITIGKYKNKRLSNQGRDSTNFLTSLRDRTVKKSQSTPLGPKAALQHFLESGKQHLRIKSVNQLE
jgi:hypothetical protein